MRSSSLLPLLTLGVGSLAQSLDTVERSSITERFNASSIAEEIWDDIKNGASRGACEAVIELLKGVLLFGNGPFVDVVTDICQIAKVEDSDVCKGAIALEGPVIADAIRGMSWGTLTSDLFCANFFGLIPQPTPPPFSLSFPSPKPATVRPSPSGKPPIKILQISDIHIDLLYQPGSNFNCTKPICCRAFTPADAPGNTSFPAGPNGNSKCDSPVSLELSLYQAMKDLVPDAAFVMFTGDIVDHSIWLTNQSYVTESVTQAYQYMSESFDFVYGVAGNHDSHPVNNFQPVSVGNSTQWVYDLLETEWQKWVEPDALSEITSTGSYSTKFPGGNLRVISLNTNFYYTQNFWMYQPDFAQDPNGQLAWLIQELDAAEKAGENVYIIGHTPPGQADAFVPQANYLDQIFNRYEATIANLFWGHTHADHFEVSYSNYSERTVDNAFKMGYICPSLTPTAGNPAFRVYEVDPDTFGVLDSITYIADMTNPAFQTTGPVWTKYYSAKEAYGPLVNPPVTDASAELTPQFWHNVIEVFQSNQGVFEDYISRKSRGAKNTTCTGDCLTAEICALQAGRSESNCVTPKPGIHLSKRSDGLDDADEHEEHAHAHRCGETPAHKLLAALPVNHEALVELENRYNALVNAGTH